MKLPKQLENYFDEKIFEEHHIKNNPKSSQKELQKLLINYIYVDEINSKFLDNILYYICKISTQYNISPKPEYIVYAMCKYASINSFYLDTFEKYLNRIKFKYSDTLGLYPGRIEQLEIPINYNCTKNIDIANININTFRRILDKYHYFKDYIDLDDNEITPFLGNILIKLEHDEKDADKLIQWGNTMCAEIVMRIKSGNEKFSAY